MIRKSVFVATIALLLWVYPEVLAQTKPVKVQPKTLTLPQAIAQIRQSVVQISVMIESTDPFVAAQTGVLGSGFEVSDGYFITAKHVTDAFQNLSIPNAKKTIGVGFAGSDRSNLRGAFRVYEVEIVDQDAIHDIALLHQKSNDILFESIQHYDNIGGTPPGFTVVPAYHPPRPARLPIERPEEGEGIATSGYPLKKTVLLTTSGTVASSWDSYKSPGAADAFQGSVLADLED
jgi:hypothetical protein